MRLTKAQRRAIYTLGQFQSIKRYGTWGKRAQWRVLWKLRDASLLRRMSIDEQFATIPRQGPYALTDEGRDMFGKLFPACAEHGRTLTDAWDKGTLHLFNCQGCCKFFRAANGYLPSAVKAADG